MKVINISGRKLEVAGHGLCAGHILEFKEEVDLTEFFKLGLLKEV